MVDTPVREAPARAEDAKAVRLDIAYVAAGVVVFLVVGFIRLGRVSLWVDEADSWWTVQGSWSYWLRAVVLWDAHAPVYFALLKPWVGLFGTSETALRSLSVLFGAATVPFVWLIARRVFGRREAMLATAVFVFTPIVVDISRQARNYSLTCLLLAVATTMLIGARQDGRVPGAGFTVAASLAILTHPLAVPVVAGFGVHSLVRARRDGEPFAWGGWIVLAVVSVVELVATQLNSMRLHFHDSSLSLSARLPAQLLYTLAGHGGPVPAVVTVGLWIVFAALLLVPWARRRAAPVAVAPRSWWSAPVVDVIIWAAVPYVVTLAISSVSAFAAPRYLTISLPALAVLTAAAICAIRLRWLAAGVAAVLLLGNIWGVGRVITGGPHEEWRAPTRIVLEQGKNTDAIAFVYPYQRLPFDYYAQGTPSSSLPVSVLPSVGWGQEWDVTGKMDIDAALKESEGATAVWILAAQSTIDHEEQSWNELYGTLKERYATIQTWSYTTSRLFRFSNPRATAG
jgi:4-amino-4-deoxy-L-arabinose transferase-like glycosyltransferase